MLTLAENVIVAGTNNRPFMLDKTQYSSWASRMLLNIKGKENRKLLVNSVLNGPFKYGTVTVPGTQTTPATVRARTYDELTDIAKIRESCDIKATNIERESKLYDEFDMFTSVSEETIYTYYLRFAQLINDMHSIRMTMKPIQIYTKFINHLQPEWSKFFTDVKLAKDLHITNFDHLYGYLRQYEAHANEEFYQPPDAHHSSVICHQSYQAPVYHPSSQASFPQLDSGLVVPSFLPLDDPISIKVQTVQGRQTQGYAGSGVRSNATISSINRNGGTSIACQTKVTCCYNCQEEGHVARQCTKPKRPRNSTWFKEKAMLAEALESGVALDEEHMAFLADTRDTVSTGQASQELVITSAFQTADLDAFDSDYDEAPSTSVVLIAKLSASKIVSSLYCGNTIVKKHDALFVVDTEETLELAEESRLSKHFVKHFMPQNQLSVEQAFWLPISKPVSKIPPVQPEPVLKEIPRELSTISLVKDSFNKMRSHVNDFESMVTVRTKYFHMFDQCLHKEITDMKEVFTQMETEVAKCFVERKTFEIKEKELIIENEHLLEHIICQDVMSVVMHADVESKKMFPANNNSLEHDNLEAELLKKENNRLLELLISQDLVHTHMNTLASVANHRNMEKSYLEEYNENLELRAKLSKKNDMVEKTVYNELSKKCARMENRCISLEIKMKLKVPINTSTRNITLI
ncbi:retrovirus-related pol polyprotein from transposon TNT 1-94 [Tanacetum coccineum]|uniref:Retrovirus-related pol polyprotein from transposon TNT 1-94 n=1 Tax=Tanacetum coccineum TaxID=301880 RepID=A0ABQ5IPL3_9ASTR